MVNSQKPEGLTWSDKLLSVCDVWDTIQGEGPFVGRPATFIRLAGCNLDCVWCDTDYTSMRVMRSLDDVVSLVGHLPVRDLVVITGGEPFRQDIEPLVTRLQTSGRHVQIETNGVLFPQNFAGVAATIVCSPKTPKIHPEIFRHCKHLKYVVRAGEIDSDGFPLTSVGIQYGKPAKPPKDWQGRVYIQPMDEGDDDTNALNLDSAMKSCQEHGHTLSVQLHKMVGVE